jgi:hypothetical protein
MKPRRSDVRRGALGLAVLLLLVTAEALAAQEGPLELVLPVGARSIGAGLAAVADQPGIEAVWWNPAALAMLRRRELALLHAAGLFPSDVVSFALPYHPIGVPVLSIQLVNLGEQESIPRGSTIPSGLIASRALIYAASFATTFGPRASAGLNFKFYQLRSDCSGVCEDLPSRTPQASAVDAGVQYRAGPANAPLWFGAAIRNVGQPFQATDAEQRDPLPLRYHVGVNYTPVLRGAPPGLRLRGAAEVVKTPHHSEPGFRAGLTSSWEDRAFARVGYIKGEGGAPSGPSLGLGIATGRLRIDLARLFGAEHQLGGEPPTHISLSAVF